MSFEEMESVLQDYLDMQSTQWSKPSWFDCLSFLYGYFGNLDVNMIMLVRQKQRNGLIE